MIFRLGRLRKGGAKGPGIFFIIPCIDTYRKVDLRTVSFDVPPQEVNNKIGLAAHGLLYFACLNYTLGLVPGFSDSNGGCRRLLSGL